MLALHLHQPVAIDHPLVAPWARAQATPTAARYASRPEVRPWQLKPEPLRGSLVVSSALASRRARKANGALTEALAAIPELEKELLLVDETDTPEGTARAELEAALAEAKAVVKAATEKRQRLLPRAVRRGVLARDVKPALRRQAWDEHVRRMGGLAA